MVLVTSVELQVCQLCLKEKKHVRRHRKTGQLACTYCYHEHLAPKHRCGYCRKIRRAEYVHRTKGPVCKDSYHQYVRIGRCWYCKKPRKLVAGRKKHKPACANCYRRRCRVRRCVDCLRMRPIHRRIGKHAFLCETCSKRDKRQGVCPRCHHRRYLSRRLRNGSPGCQLCHQQEHPARCRKCRRVMPIRSLGLCTRCYGHRCRKRCVYCHRMVQPNHRTPEGRLSCASCWRQHHPGACRRCGQEGILAARGLCHSCYNKIRKLHAKYHDGARVQCNGWQGIVRHAWDVPGTRDHLQHIGTYLYVETLTANAPAYMYWPPAQVTLLNQ